MTALAVLVLCFALISSSHQAQITDEAARKARADCIKESGVTEELVDKAEDGEFPDDRNFKCFTKCFYAQLGYVNDSGDPQLELIKEHIPEPIREKGHQVIEKCKDVQGDPCEKAYQLHKCYFEQIVQV